MQLSSLSLKNIRSYESLQLEFQEGITLLTGDIGSGKSTILLAIEFALFGIIRGSLNGNSLLRRGKKEGYVELNFIIENKNVTIRRGLKKTPNGYSQETGFLRINENTYEGTAIELKAKILELLGYPEDLLTKSKTLIYRYTIYTPQEEMKTIIQETSEQRLEKLRKVFNVDKYKTVKENTTNYAKQLREEMKYLEGSFEGLKDDYEKIGELEKQNKQVLLEMNKQEQFVKKAKSELELKELELKKYEKQKAEIETIKQEIQSIKNKEEINNNNVEQYNKQTEFLNKEIEELKKIKKPEFKTENLEELKIKRKKLLEKIELIIENITKASNKKAVLESQKSDSEITKINHLQTCPTCKQEVKEEHKKRITEEHKKIVLETNNKIKQYDEYITKASNKKAEIKQKQELIEEQIQQQLNLKKEHDQYQQIFNQLKNKEEQINFNKNKTKLLKEKNKEILEKEKVLVEKLNKQSFDKEKYLLLKEEERNKRDLLQEQLIKQAEIKQEQKYSQQKIEELKKQISKKEKQKNLLEQKRILHNWIIEHFNNLMDLIEKHILVNIHKEFNEQFKEWFELLLEDESLEGELDETFTPLIRQDGYDAEVENLSGGEKTATALAYRLALNKVINNYVSDIKTKDLIILDEPTDGFSNDQLDKIRDVLPELDCKQVIMVSHEQKLESMAENIIKIQKTEHESRVV